MVIDTVPKPNRTRIAQWTGDNVDQVNAYLTSMSEGPTATAWIVVDEGGNAHVASSYYPNKPVQPGEWIYATYSMWGGPLVTVYSGDEVNALFYPYPDYPPIVEPPNSGV